MFRGHRSQLGRSPASQGPSGEQSGGDDHTGGVSDTQQNQVYSHDLSDVDNLIRQSTSSGTATHADQQTSTGYDVSASQHVFHPKADFNPGHYLDDVPFIQTNEDLSANHMPNFAEATSFSQRSLLDAGHDSSGNPVESCMYGNGVQVQGHSAISSRGFQGLLSEAELESIISSERGAKLAKLDDSTSSLALPASSSQSHSHTTYESSGQMRRVYCGEIQGLYGEQSGGEDDSLGARNARPTTSFPGEIPGVETFKEYLDAHAPPSSTSHPHEYMTDEEDPDLIWGDISDVTQKDYPEEFPSGPTTHRGHYHGEVSQSNRFQEVQQAVVSGQRGATRRDIFPPSTFSSETELETVSSLKSTDALDRGNIIHWQPSQSQTRRHIHDGESTHPTRGSRIDATMFRGRLENHVGFLVIGKSDSHQGLAPPSSSAHGNSATCQQQSNQILGTPRTAYASFLEDVSIISTHGSHSVPDCQTRDHSFTYPSTTATELAANHCVTVVISQSTGTLGSGLSIEEFRKPPVNILASLLTPLESCATATLDNISYQVCLTDSWSKLNLATRRMHVSCGFSKIRSADFTRQFQRGFKFTCGLADTYIEMYRRNNHRVFVGLQNTELKGDMGIGWIPPSDPFTVAGRGRGNALCGSIPRLNGSVGVLAMKVHPTEWQNADLFTKRLLDSLPGGNVTQIGQFNVLISNGNTHILYRGVDYSPSTTLFSVVVRESDYELIVRLPQDETKKIKLVRCKELGPRTDTGRNLDEDLKMLHSSIIRTGIMEDMVDDNTSSANARHSSRSQTRTGN